MKLIWNGAARDAFRLSFPIEKTEKLDDGRLMVRGVATSEAFDQDGEVMDYGAAKAAFSAWAGNIREQHDPKKAVGKAIEVSADDATKQITVKAFISAGAPDTQAKLLDGTLSCFSIGGKVSKRSTEPLTKADGSVVQATRVFVKSITETSVVDVGSNPESGVAIVKSVGDDLVWAEAGDTTQKSLYELREFAAVVQSIGWLAAQSEWEEQSEGDSSPVPAQLREWLGQGLAILQAMAAEECAEMMAEINSMVPPMKAVAAVEAAAGAGDLAKAGKRFSTSTKAALKAAHDACKAADKALADLGYEDAETDDEGEADGKEPAKAAGTDDDLQKAAEAQRAAVDEVAKAVGLELTDLTTEALTKAAIKALVDLRKTHADLLASPAAAKGVLRAVVVDKVVDAGGEIKETAPVLKSDGSVNEVATLIKAARVMRSA